MKMKGLIKDLLERLDYLEEQRICSRCSASLKDKINTLKIELKFLRTFFMCKKLMRIGSGDLKDRYKKIKAVIQQDVGQVILSLGDGEPLDLFSVQEKIELIKLEVHQCYHDMKKFWATGYTEGDLLVQCIDYVFENMKDLLIQSDQVNSIVGVKKLINTLERWLRFLRNSLQFVAKLELSKWDLYDLKKAVGYETTIAASFFFSCWIKKMESDGEETCHYDRILDATKSLTSDATVYIMVGFIDFLLQQLAELLSRDASVEIRTKDHFESLREDLKVVRSFLTMKTATDPHPDHVKSHRQHIGAELNKVARLIKDWHVRDMNEEMMSMDNTIFLPSLGRRKLISLLCMEDLVNDESSSTAPMKDQLETLREDIRLLRTFYIETQNGDHVHQEIKDIHSLMDVMALEAGSAIYSFSCQ